jgi:hypothetical protein
MPLEGAPRGPATKARMSSSGIWEKQKARWRCWNADEGVCDEVIWCRCVQQKGGVVQEGQDTTRMQYPEDLHGVDA